MKQMKTSFTLFDIPVFGKNVICADVVEWQTRLTQNQVPLVCGFKSRHRHQFFQCRIGLFDKGSIFFYHFNQTVTCQCLVLPD